MTQLIEHARSAYSRRLADTADYIFDVSGLAADKKIVEYVEAELKRTAPVDDKAYLTLLSTGTPRYMAAQKLGIDPVTVMRRLRIDSDFLDRVKVAEAMALEPAIQTAHQLAKAGEKWALTFLLERKSEEYAPPDKRINVNHNVNHRHELALSGVEDPIDREILELARDLKEQRETRALNAGVIDIPEEDIEDL